MRMLLTSPRHGNWTQKCLVSCCCLVARMALFCFDFISWGSPSTPMLSLLRALQIFISHLHNFRVKGFRARNDLAWRITWAALFAQEEASAKRSGGLSKITGLLRGPLGTRSSSLGSSFCYSCCRGNFTELLAFSFPLWGFRLTAGKRSPRWGFLFSSPNLLYLLSVYFLFQFYLLICVV